MMKSPSEDQRMTASVHYDIVGSVGLEYRRGGDWDIAAEREKVQEWGGDPFVLWVLEAVPYGNAQCGGCRQIFNTTREIAVIASWVADDGRAADVVPYCLACARKHADELADATWRHHAANA
jgi:hypothetical protein